MEYICGIDIIIEIANGMMECDRAGACVGGGGKAIEYKERRTLLRPTKTKFHCLLRRPLITSSLLFFLYTNIIISFFLFSNTKIESKELARCY